MHLKEYKDNVLSVKNKLYRFALRMLSDEDEAKDVVQEVLIRLWNKHEEIYNYQNVEAWCITVTKNICLDKFRFRNRRKVQAFDAHFDVADNSGNPHCLTEAKDTLIRIHGFINALPEKQKMVIQLKEIEGYSYQEIADALEINISQVKVNLFRARKTIQEKLINSDAYGL